MRIWFCTFFACLLVLFSCSGKEQITRDKIPPLKPDLIQHLGDLGDDPLIAAGDTLFLNDNNNGIDAVPDGDWLKISWQHLLDSDLDFIKIYRFDEQNLDPEPIDTISFDNDFYIDSKVQLTTYLRYSYFIEAFDQSGNSSISDTVSYKLISKTILNSPNEDATIDPLGTVTLSWNRGETVARYRLLVFDSEQNLIYPNPLNPDPATHDIPVDFAQDIYSVNLPNGLLAGFAGDYVYWRVDSFDWDTILGMYIGSESVMRRLNIAARK